MSNRPSRCVPASCGSLRPIFSCLLLPLLLSFVWFSSPHSETSSETIWLSDRKRGRFFTGTPVLRGEGLRGSEGWTKSGLQTDKQRKEKRRGEGGEKTHLHKWRRGKTQGGELNYFQEIQSKNMMKRSRKGRGEEERRWSFSRKNVSDEKTNCKCK